MSKPFCFNIHAASACRALIFQTARSRRATGYPDFHHLGSHAMSRALNSSGGAIPRDIMEFFGSRPDWSFFVHGAAWSVVTDACRKGDLRFKENDDSLDVVLQPGFHFTQHLCPSSQSSVESGAVNPPWIAECHHGFGHGAFMYAVESLAAEEKVVTVSDVFRRGEAICLAVVGGANPASKILRDVGTEGFACFTGLWMAATQIETATWLFYSNPARYKWGEATTEQWKADMFEAMKGWPSFCFRRGTEYSTAKRSTLSSQDMPHKTTSDDDDILTAACIASSNTNGVPSVLPDTCVATTRSPSNSTGATALMCAVSTGAVMLASTKDYAAAQKKCGLVYPGGELNDDVTSSKSSVTMPMRLLYLGCVHGTGIFARHALRGDYAANEGCAFDFLYKPHRVNKEFNFHATRVSMADHTMHLLKKVRYFSLEGAVRLCSRLAVVNKDFVAFGACIGGALGDRPAFASDSGACLITIAAGYERSKRKRLGVAVSGPNATAIVFPQTGTFDPVLDPSCLENQSEENLEEEKEMAEFGVFSG